MRYLTLALTAVAACQPRWDVAVGTDAPIPQLGDWLHAQVLRPDGTLACADCSQSIPAAGPERWPLTFSVEAPATPTRLLLRLRLFRKDHVMSGHAGAPETAFIDGLAWLPALSGRITYVGMTLNTACFHHAADLTTIQSCEASSGNMAAAPELIGSTMPQEVPSPGSYPPAAVRPCMEQVPDGMICVPGGLLVLGDEDHLVSAPGAVSGPVRLIQLTPFAIDRDEVTVAQFLKIRSQNPMLDEPQPKWPDPMYPWLDCTYPSDLDKPVNCLSHALAAAACAARGPDFRLPTEAEWEYVAGNLAAETPLPYSETLALADICSHAAVALDRRIGELGGTGDRETTCRQPGRGPGPAPVGTSGDITRLGVRDLTGNVSEWVADPVAPYSAPCWSSRQVPLVDWSCQQPPPEHASKRGIRGNSWQGKPQLSAITRRDYLASDGAAASIGFRCIKQLGR